VKAKLDAEARFDKSALGREQWLREQAEKLIDKIDPLELTATVAGAFVIYDLIMATPEFLAEAKKIAIISVSPILAIIIDKFLGGIELTAEQKAEYQKLRETPDFILFIKSFAISYMMIKNGGQIISGVGSITKFVAGALGLEVAVI